MDIVLATHGNMELTIRCVKALSEHTDTPFHLVIMDDSTPDMNEGTDLTPEWCKRYAVAHPNVTYYHSDESYPSYLQLVSRSLPLCKTGLVALMGNSCVVEPCWDTAAFQLLQNMPRVGIVGVKVINQRTGVIESAGIGTSDNGVTLMDISKGQLAHRATMVYECDAIEGALIIARKAAIEAGIKGDVYHGFKGCEDLEICFGARSQGWRVFYCGMGATFHQAFSTRHIRQDSDVVQNHENKELFAKRWGLWTPSLKLNPATTEYRPDVAERPDKRQPIVATVNSRGEMVGSRRV